MDSQAYAIVRVCCSSNAQRQVLGFEMGLAMFDSMAPDSRKTDNTSLLIRASKSGFKQHHFFARDILQPMLQCANTVTRDWHKSIKPDWHQLISHELFPELLQNNCMLSHMSMPQDTTLASMCVSLASSSTDVNLVAFRFSPISPFMGM